jgi:serine/threonine-protein kinase RsbW
MSLEELKSPENIEEIDWIVPTDIGWVGPIVEKLIKELDTHGWDKDSEEVNAIQLTFREALINAIAHGNLNVAIPDGSNEDISAIAERKLHENPTDKKVYVYIKIEPTTVEITVRDEGEGFDPEALPDPTSVENILKPKGRGIQIYMKGFLDDVIFKKLEKGMEVKMIKHRS